MVGKKIKIIGSALFLLFLLLSLSTVVFLVRQKQLIKKKAVIEGFPSCVIGARKADYPQYTGTIYLQPDNQRQEGNLWKMTWRLWGAPAGKRFKAEIKMHRCRNLPPDPSGYDQCHSSSPETKIIEFAADQNGNSHFTLEQSVDCCEKDQADLVKLIILEEDKQVEIPWGSSFFIRQAWQDSCQALSPTPTSISSPTPTSSLPTPTTTTSPTPSPQPTPTPSTTLTVTPTPSLTPTLTPTSSPSLTTTPTRIPTSSPLPTPTTSAGNTATPTPTLPTPGSGPITTSFILTGILIGLMGVFFLLPLP